jgi:UDPglucose--hexose-1-phosphate uridylyltransferase
MSIEPEFRRDPVSGRWAVIAPQRSHRPKMLEDTEPRHRQNGEQKACPFCPGLEHETPDEVLAYRIAGSPPNGPGWHLRVIPNKFPAVRPDLSGSFHTTTAREFLTAPGLGHAEVVIECPQHFCDPTQLSDGQFSAVFRAYRDRICTLAHEQHMVYAAVFKNVGAEAGASLGHTHSQIIATPFVPQSIEIERAGAAAYYSRTAECVFCAIVHREFQDHERVIARSENFLVIAAFAPRFDYEFWLLPIHHASRYETISETACLELAQLMKQMLSALNEVLEQPAYNWFLHTSPLRSPELPDYHWHIEVLPRTARPAGLEWGFGCFIASVSPEQSARELRAALSSRNPTLVSQPGKSILTGMFDV